MNSTSIQSVRELIDRINASWQPAYDALVEAQRKAREAEYLAYSNSVVARITMDGTFKTRYVEINPELYEEIGEDDLEDAILSAYTNSRNTVQRALTKTIRHTPKDGGEQ